MSLSTLISYIKAGDLANTNYTTDTNDDNLERIISIGLSEIYRQFPIKRDIDSGTVADDGTVTFDNDKIIIIEEVYNDADGSDITDRVIHLNTNKIKVLDDSVTDVSIMYRSYPEDEESIPKYLFEALSAFVSMKIFSNTGNKPEEASMYYARYERTLSKLVELGFVRHISRSVLTRDSGFI